jgi:hypothetical protein
LTIAKNDEAGARQADLQRCLVRPPCGGCVASVVTAVPPESATEVDVIGGRVRGAYVLPVCCSIDVRTAQRTLGS